MSEKQQGSAAPLFSAPFLACVLILGITAAGLPWATSYMRIALTKEPIPLRSPLARLDKDRLGPYVFRAKQDLLDTVVEALGTDQYIYWILEDTTYGPGSTDPRRFARLFVTYYTGQPDPVPHTPDVCMLGSGYTVKQAENTTVSVPALSDSTTVPVRAVTFEKTGIFDSDLMTVIYTFHCSGRFAETRESVRLIVNNPVNKYAYYSKVEVIFGTETLLARYPSRDESIAATEKLLSYVLPLLVEEHWPDWEAARRGEVPITGNIR